MRKPKITKKEFTTRRKNLMGMLGNNAIAIVPSSSFQIRNRDVEYHFRQNSDFLYLTNFNEPDSIAVFIPEREQGEYILFCRDKDPQAEQWTGIRSGVEGVIENYDADDSFPIEDIDDILPGLMEGRKSVYYSMGSDHQFDQQVMEWVNTIKKKIRNGAHSPHEFISLDLFLHELRLIKSNAEIRMMKYAAQISIDAHHAAMKNCKPKMWEYEIDALFQYEFCRKGLSHAYTSIVGGGKNACILHYIENNQKLNNDELLLIDAGSEHSGYASDITRTFPIGGKYSEPQRQLYQIVLDAQKAAIDKAKPNNTWNQPHEAAVECITRGLVEVGILGSDSNLSKKENIQKLIDGEAYKPHFMHKTGHWLGLDVHDVGDYKVDEEWRTFEVGMVLTVEPGLYISPADNVDEKWWNIGIRIEDDIAITKDGNEVLTQGLIKETAEIEAYMSHQ